MNGKSHGNLLSMPTNGPMGNLIADQRAPVVARWSDIILSSPFRYAGRADERITPHRDSITEPR